MTRRLARLALALVMVVFVAATPLSAHLSGGVHETWLPGYQSPTYKRARDHVILLDHTGLVRAIAPAGDAQEELPTAITVTWFGCGTGSTLTFDRLDGRYLIADQSPFECQFFNGTWRSIVIHFSQFVDPRLIKSDSPGFEINGGS